MIQKSDLTHYIATSKNEKLNATNFFLGEEYMVVRNVSALSTDPYGSPVEFIFQFRG